MEGVAISQIIVATVGSEVVQKSVECAVELQNRSTDRSYGIMKIVESRGELRRLRPADLFKMASNQKEHNCVLNPNGLCEFYFKFKGFGFCVLELSGQGCQAEKARAGEHSGVFKRL
jgi:hypothetical protein